MVEEAKKDGGQQKPLGILTKYSPYMVVDLANFRDAQGKPLPVQAVMSLCR